MASAPTPAPTPAPTLAPTPAPKVLNDESEPASCAPTPPPTPAPSSAPIPAPKFLNDEPEPAACAASVADDLYDLEPAVSRAEMLQNIERCLAVLGAGVVSMTVFIKTLPGETITVDIKASDTIDKFKALIMDRRSTFSIGGKQLKDGLVSDYYHIQKESTVFEGIMLDGGAGGVLKHHLKHADAVKALKTAMVGKLRAVKKLKELGPDVADVDAELVAYVRTIETKVDDIKVLKATGADILKGWVRFASDEDLATASDILGNRGGLFSRRIGSEEMIEKLIPICMPSVRGLETGAMYLNQRLAKTMKDIAEIVVEECNSYQNGAAVMDLKSLHDRIKHEVDDRKDGDRQRAARCVIC